MRSFLTPLLAVMAVAVLVAPSASLAAQSDQDREGVRRAALDYIEGFYEGDSTKLVRSIRPEVTKFGFHRQDAAAAYGNSPLSFQQMMDYARRVRSSGRGAPDGAPKQVRILDILDQTAAVKVTAFWGTDYIHLAKYDGKWMIVHVLWQTPNT
jgi:hypothetical protein